jgi:glycosyltransferase involved in cell wall biosynthesis
MNVYLDSKMHIQLQRLDPIFKERNVNLIRKPDKCDVQLSLVHFRKKTNLPKVTRIDGIYYNLAIPYRKLNRSISTAHRESNGIIYQSKFSMDMCEKYLHQRTTNNFEIVYNGIEPNWSGNFKEHDGINVVVSAKWRRFKRLSEIIDIFIEFNKIVKNSKLHVIGILHENKIVKHPNIIYYGMIKFDKISEIYREGDIFIHLAKNDSCPKTVTEAIGSGMPVITSGACGGATEMALITPGCVICKGDNYSLEPDYVYQNKWNIVSANLRTRVLNSMLEISNDKRRVVLPQELHINTTADKYIKVLNGAIKHD